MSSAWGAVKYSLSVCQKLRKLDFVGLQVGPIFAGMRITELQIEIIPNKDISTCEFSKQENLKSSEKNSEFYGHNISIISCALEIKSQERNYVPDFLYHRYEKFILQNFLGKLVSPRPT